MGASGSKPSVTPEDTLGVFEDLNHQCAPLAATDVADTLECERRTARDNLDQLVERGDLETRDVGSHGPVWWRPIDAGNASGLDLPGPEREQFEDVVRAVEDYAVLVLDRDGNVASWNEGAERISGYARDEIVGEHVSVLYTEDDAERGVPTQNLDAAEERGRIETEGWRTREDGSEFRAHVVITAIRDDDGSLRGFTRITRDVTERKHREETLRRERELTEQLLETAPIAIAVQDADGETILANQRAQDLLGLSEREIIEESGSADAVDVCDTDGEPLDPGETPTARVHATGEPVFNEEVVIDRPDGERLWVSVNAVPLFDSDGDLERVVTAAEDVTKLKEQARQLERQRDELRTELDEVFERVTDAFYALDEEWRFTHVNDRAEEIIERREAAVLGESIWEVFPEATDSVLWERYHEAMETQEPVSFELQYDSLGIWLEMTAYPSESGLSVYFRDVTDRALRERELEQYRAIVESVNDGVYTVDETGTITRANASYAEMIGRTREELTGMDAAELVDDDVAESARALEREFVAGERDAATLEAELDTATDESLVVETRFSLLPGEDESYERVAVVRDVTERKERERALKRYERLIGNLPVGVYRNRPGPKGEFVEANEALADIFDADSVEEFLEHGAAELYPDSERRQAFSRRLEREGSVRDVELEQTTLDGETIWISVTAIRVEEDGEVYFDGIVQDVTERKQRERALEQYETVFDTVQDGIYVLGPDFHFEDVNDAYTEMTGYDEEELIGSHCSLVVSEDVSEESADLLEEITVGDASSATIEADIHRADGSRLPAESKFTAVSGPNGEQGRKVGVVRDLTERKERERELRQYETLIEESTDVNAIVDPGETIEYVTPSVEHVLGYAPEELVGENAFEYVHPSDRDETRAALVELVEGDESRTTIEFRFRHADGSWIWLEARGRDLLDDPMIDGVVVYTRDVTDHKEYERELGRRARQQAVVSELGQRALENPDIDELFDEAARRVAETLDTDYCKVLDLDPDAGELLLRQGVGWEDGTVGEASVRADDNSQAGYTLLSEEPVVVDDLAAETRFSGPELLTSHDVTSGISTIIGSRDDPWGILGTHDTRRLSFTDEDVDFVQSVANVLAAAIERQNYQNELEDLVDELEESNERLEQFAYIASHDLQEPLRMVSNYLQLVEDRYADELDEDGEEFIEFAVDGADRMREMIDDLLAYSRVDTDAEPLEPTDAEDVVESVRKQLEMQIQENDVEITVESLPTVAADRKQLEQVFQNLVSNAIKYRGDEPPRIEIGVEERGDEWVFHVADNGIGIEPDRQDRVFEVFKRLHTHEDYSGTGIGLALCRKIVERHGGRIWVDSDPGEGSTFYFSVSTTGDDDG